MRLEELTAQVTANTYNIELLKEKMLELIGVMQEMADEIKNMKGEEKWQKS